MVRHRTTRAPGSLTLTAAGYAAANLPASLRTSPVGGWLLSVCSGRGRCKARQPLSLRHDADGSQASILWDPEYATVHHLSSIMHGSPAANPASGAGAQVSRWLAPLSRRATRQHCQPGACLCQVTLWLILWSFRLSYACTRDARAQSVCLAFGRSGAMATVSDLMLRRPCINVLTGQQDMPRGTSVRSCPFSM